MSADFRTEHYKGYLHHDQFAKGPAREERAWIHVTQADHDSDYAIGDFSLADLGELVQMAGQAWPARVEVRYVIETRRTVPRPGKAWRTMWSAVAAGDDGDGGVSEEFAQATFAGLRSGSSSTLEWRLARRTTLTHDEVLPAEETGS